MSLPRPTYNSAPYICQGYNHYNSVFEKLSETLEDKIPGLVLCVYLYTIPYIMSFTPLKYIIC